MTMPTYEELHDDDITDAVLVTAARLFSKHYGVWGTPPVSFSNPFVKTGISFFLFSTFVSCLPAHVLFADSSRSTGANESWPATEVLRAARSP
jgi:hypothetical protein